MNHGCYYEQWVGRFLPHDLDYLVVPSKIDGVVVREVKGFSYLENVDTVILPNTVEVIRW